LIYFESWIASLAAAITSAPTTPLRVRNERPGRLPTAAEDERDAGQLQEENTNTRKTSSLLLPPVGHAKLPAHEQKKAKSLLHVHHRPAQHTSEEHFSYGTVS